MCEAAQFKFNIRFNRFKTKHTGMYQYEYHVFENVL